MFYQHLDNILESTMFGSALERSWFYPEADRKLQSFLSRVARVIFIDPWMFPILFDDHEVFVLDLGSLIFYSHAMPISLPPILKDEHSRADVST